VVDVVGVDDAELSTVSPARKPLPSMTAVLLGIVVRLVGRHESEAAVPLGR
jgi:hypothetical protein